MRENLLEYKGYSTVIEYSAEDMVLHGKIEGINDLVTFESESAKDIEKEFQAAVDDYLQMCQELDQEPNKAYSGNFNVRISPMLHKQLVMNTLRTGMTLNKTVAFAIDEYLNNFSKSTLDKIWKAVSTASANACSHPCTVYNSANTQSINWNILPQRRMIYVS